MKNTLPIAITKTESDTIDILLEKTTDEEKRRLLDFINDLIRIREQNIPRQEKIKQTLMMYKKSKAVWPLIKNIKALLWDNRSLATKIGVGLVAVTATFMPGNAGIAAFGTAIGVPLWVVVGGGYAFAKMAAERFQNALTRGDIQDAKFTVINE